MVDETIERGSIQEVHSMPKTRDRKRRITSQTEQMDERSEVARLLSNQEAEQHQQRDAALRRNPG